MTPTPHTSPQLHQLRARCEATWNACYPDRRKWADIDEASQAEWLRVFEVFDSLNSQSPPNDEKLPNAPTVPTAD